MESNDIKKTTKEILKTLNNGAKREEEIKKMLMLKGVNPDRFIKPEEIDKNRFKQECTVFNFATNYLLETDKIHIIDWIKNSEEAIFSLT